MTDTKDKNPSDPTPAQERREEIARIIEPESFGALDRIYLIPTDKEFSCMAAARVKADAILALPPPKGEPSQEPVAFMFWNDPDTQRHLTTLRESIGDHWQNIVPLYALLPPELRL